ncbi:MAG: transglycosylase family protein [Acidimicrobiales bacterium]
MYTPVKGTAVLSRTKVNERWRVAIAGLVAALAIPILVIDSPSTAQGAVESVESTPDAVAPEVKSETVERSAPVDTPVQVVVSTTVLRPDIVTLAERAAEWADAREIAVEQGLFQPSNVPAPSNTRLDLLPVVVEPTPSEPDPAPAPEEGEGADPGEGEGTDPGEGEGTDPGEGPPPETDIPAPPAQVDGRVPPPDGGPTAAQWNALRNCESTHNYQAISPSGLYRGAYQFSQQTWNWVSGIHWPFLTGIDPVDAPAGWQDVMAYTLYAMRGWDQWPICGKNLL